LCHPNRIALSARCFMPPVCGARTALATESPKARSESGIECWPGCATLARLATPARVGQRQESTLYGQQRLARCHQVLLAPDQVDPVRGQIVASPCLGARHVTADSTATVAPLAQLANPRPSRAFRPTALTSTCCLAQQLGRRSAKLILLHGLGEVAWQDRLTALADGFEETQHVGVRCPPCLRPLRGRHADQKYGRTRWAGLRDIGLPG
jgi:hypothetical protein